MNKQTPPPAKPESVKPTKPDKPIEKRRGPVPKLNDRLMRAANELKTQLARVAREAQQLLDEAKQVKSQDRAAWVTGLEEAATKCGEGRDLFNDFVGRYADDIPTNDDWPDEEEILNEYVGQPLNQIQRVQGEVNKTKPMK